MKNTIKSLVILSVAVAFFFLNAGNTHANAFSYPSYTFDKYSFLSANGSMLNTVLSQQQSQDYVQAQLSNIGPYSDTSLVPTTFTSSEDGSTLIVNDFSGQHNASITHIEGGHDRLSYKYATTNNEGSIYTVVFNGDLQDNIMTCHYNYDEVSSNGSYHLESNFLSTIKRV